MQTQENGQTLLQETERYRLLLEINNAISSTLSMQDLFHAVSKSLYPIFQHDSAEKNELRAYALDVEEGFNVVPNNSVSLLEGTPIGLAVITREVVIVTEPDRKRFTSPLTQKTGYFAQ